MSQLNPLATVDDIFLLLGADPSRLIGQPESQILEFKAVPYRLAEDDQKFELVKDLTAMANSSEGEGVIIIGVVTKQDIIKRREEAASLRPVSLGELDPEQINAIVDSWVFPKLRVEIREHEVTAGVRDRLLWSLHARLQPGSESPYMIVRELQNGKSERRNSFSIYRRDGTNCRPYSPEQIYHWIRTGYAGSMQIDQSGTSAVDLSSAGEITRSEDVAAAQLVDKPHIVLQVSPTTTSEIQRFYKSEPGSVYHQIGNYEPIRKSGFWFGNRSFPELTEYRGLRISVPEFFSVSVTRNGLLTGVAGIDLLTWASKERGSGSGPRWVNPLALVEFVSECSRFYSDVVLPALGSSRTCRWRCIEAFDDAAGRVLLASGGLGTVGPLAPQPYRGVDLSPEVTWKMADAGEWSQLAHLILRDIYSKFGLGPSAIPYSKKGQVDIESILAVNDA